LSVSSQAIKFIKNGNPGRRERYQVIYSQGKWPGLEFGF
jgi:hypothetical protein